MGGYFGNFHRGPFAKMVVGKFPSNGGGFKQGKCSQNDLKPGLGIIGDLTRPISPKR